MIYLKVLNMINGSIRLGICR